MKLEVDIHLRELLSSADKVFWAGTKPPFPRMHADERILSPNSDYRLPCNYHETFDLVYLNEVDLGTIKAWPIVVDEALRLLAPKGILVIRMSDSPLLSIYALKNQLFCWGALSSYFEHKFSDGSYLLAVRNERSKKRMESIQTSVSFGVVTDGKRIEQLDRFISSVEALKTNVGQNIEVIICGPNNLDISRYKKRINVSLIIEPERFIEQGWITRKKNLIVESAKYENLVLVHDRYFFPPDFLECLERFGFDFDVMTCRQLTEDGERAADWVTVGDSWLWTAPAMMAYGDWTPHVYINGGIIIAKTRVLREQPWNDLLFWMQAEDVELTRRLRASGYVPRFSRNVTANTALLRRGSIEVMEAVPKSNKNYWLPTPAGWGNRQLTLRTVPPKGILNLTGGDEEFLADQGIYLDDAWSLVSQGVLLSAGCRGEITFRLAWAPTSDLVLDVAMDNSEKLADVYVNGLPVSIVVTGPGSLQLVCPHEAFQFSMVLRIKYQSAGNVLLRQIQVAKNLGLVQLTDLHYPALSEGQTFVQSNNLASYIFVYLKNNPVVRKIYLKLKQNEKLKTNPLVLILYRQIRKFLEKAR